MLLVIFGAGASYDSAASYLPKKSAHESARLPLADQMFDDRASFAEALRLFPACQPIIPFLRHRQESTTVESILERLQAEATKTPQGYREMAAIRYYLQWMLWDCEHEWDKIHKGVTNYKALLYLIRQNRRDSSPVCLVTFNYDTMLEVELPTVEAQVTCISDYVHGSEYKIFKIHGSVNWGRRIEPLPLKELHTLGDAQIANEVIRLAPQIFEQKLVSNNYVFAGNGVVRKVDDRAIFPAIAIPVETKLDFECPLDHVEVLKKHLPQTSKLLVIGWRATDAPFLELLRAHLPPHISAMTVAGSREEAENVVENFGSAGIRRKEFLCSNSGFTGFIQSGEAESFLKA